MHALSPHVCTCPRFLPFHLADHWQPFSKQELRRVCDSATPTTNPEVLRYFRMAEVLKNAEKSHQLAELVAQQLGRPENPSISLVQSSGCGKTQAFFTLASLNILVFFMPCTQPGTGSQHIYTPFQSAYQLNYIWEKDERERKRKIKNYLGCWAYFAKRYFQTHPESTTKDFLLIQPHLHNFFSDEDNIRRAFASDDMASEFEKLSKALPETAGVRGVLWGWDEGVMLIGGPDLALDPAAIVRRLISQAGQSCAFASTSNKVATFYAPNSSESKESSDPWSVLVWEYDLVEYGGHMGLLPAELAEGEKARCARILIFCARLSLSHTTHASIATSMRDHVPVFPIRRPHDFHTFLVSSISSRCAEDFSKCWSSK